jgi:predicted O-methyltransferase YrrM
VDRAGLSGVIEIRVGRAIDALPKLASEAPFDFIFIDADKPSTLAYFEWAVKLSRPGTVIIVDNVVRDGALVDEPVTDENIKGMRRFLAGLASETRADGTVIQTVGAKGYDGFAIAIV